MFGEFGSGIAHFGWTRQRLGNETAGVGSLGFYNIYDINVQYRKILSCSKYILWLLYLGHEVLRIIIIEVLRSNCIIFSGIHTVEGSDGWAFDTLYLWYFFSIHINKN